MNGRPNIFGMTPVDLQDFLGRHGVVVRDGEARRILGHIISNGRAGFPENPVPKRVMAGVDGLLDRCLPDVVEFVEDPVDVGFAKFLLRAGDGCLFEAVRIPLEGGGRYSVCLSSQVGCAMGCSFCATGRLGLTRNLTAAEMVGAFVVVRGHTQGRLSGAVFMGQGEPLANTSELFQATKVLTDPCGGRIRADSITISTVGLVPKIREFIALGRPYRLIISLHSTIDERRAKLMPHAARWSVGELVEVIHEYGKVAVGGRVTIAWVMLPEINMGDDEVEGIARLLEGVPLRLNLIDLNDSGQGGFRKATPEEVRDFRWRLNQLRVPVVRRYSGGVASQAACGMLASQKINV